jgi:hypothetical protein
MTIIGLETYALLLAWYQLSIGVRTDEAKYLLDIPYPHPPLARFIISIFDSWQYHELFWRIVFATLMIQFVWFVVALLHNAKPSVRFAASLCWLLSAAVVLQAGTVMMAVLTALQALVFVWLFLRNRSPAGQEYLVALFWLISLFTAYQAVLFLPLVWAILRRSGISFFRQIVLLGVPVFLLALYTLSNPLVPASMITHAGKDAGETLLMHLLGALHLWILAGSIVLSIVGTIGLFLKPKAGLLLSLGLVAAYVFISRFDYYAILFAPLLIAGTVNLLRRFPALSTPLIVLMPIGLAVCLVTVPPSPASTVPEVYERIDARSGEGEILITGSFGHEWQYGTSSVVRRYDLAFLDTARAVICIRPCEEMQQQAAWERLSDTPVRIWVRR